MKKFLLLAALAITPLALAQNPADDDDPPDANVNTRYTVESVQVAYAKAAHKKPELSMTLKADVDQVVGQKLDNSRLGDLAARIKKELHVSDVSFNVAKGKTPDHVSVTFEVKEHEEKFDLDMPKFVYHSRQGWSGEGIARMGINGNDFIFGIVSDNDAIAERFAGIRAGYERKNVGTDRFRLKFMFSSLHDQWNRATLLAQNAVAATGIYRSRQSFTPEATVVLAPGLELGFGADFTRIHPDLASNGPDLGSSGAALALRSAGTESSNAVVSTLRYHQRWGSGKDRQESDLHGSYSIKAARPWLESDFAFARHLAEAGYKYRHGGSRVDVKFLAGHISGDAPIYERFVLGNSHTLRGWNKFDLNPSGAANAIHGTVEYSYRGFLVFYDTGAAWDHKRDREQKQSLGVGFRTKDGFQLAVAFPVRNGSVDPVFYAGIGF